jgi:hypothetical protein
MVVWKDENPREAVVHPLPITVGTEFLSQGWLNHGYYLDCSVAPSTFSRCDLAAPYDLDFVSACLALFQCD